MIGGGNPAAADRYVVHRTKPPLRESRATLQQLGDTLEARAQRLVRARDGERVANRVELDRGWHQMDAASGEAESGKVVGDPRRFAVIELPECGDQPIELLDTEGDGVVADEELDRVVARRMRGARHGETVATCTSREP